MEQLKLLSTTTVLTLLIWASADSLVNETVSVGAFFRISGEVGRQDMLVVSNAAQSFQLQLSGPRRQISQVKDAAPLTLRLNLPEQPTRAVRVPLKPLLDEQWRQFPSLRVVAVEPAEVEVFVDHLVVKEVEVTLKQGLTLDYDVNPRLDPRTVRVVMRESHYIEAFENPGRPLRIELDPEPQLRDAPKGRPASALLALNGSELGFGDESEFTPTAVRVSATVRANRIIREIPTVPIQIAVSFANFGRPLRLRVAEIPEGVAPLITRTIKISGPADVVERLLTGPTPIGIVRLKEENFARLGVQQSFMPDFHLPPSVELVEEPEPVLITLEEP